MDNYTVLLRFIYDTCSFSDRLMQLTAFTTATEPTAEKGNELTPCQANIDTAEKEEGKPL